LLEGDGKPARGEGQRALWSTLELRRPRDFILDEDLYEIADVEDRWYEPHATYFRVRTTEGKRYILRHDEQADEWALQSGFDGDELLARPSIAYLILIH
jgi:hypothetical protein